MDVRRILSWSSAVKLSRRNQCVGREKRLFSCSAVASGRAIVYTQHGDPSKHLRVITYPTLPPPAPNSVNIDFTLSPINPADINVIEGVYPSKPSRIDALTGFGLDNGNEGTENAVFIGGNEGLARVSAVGSGVQTLGVGDWVIMIKQQSGTWTTDKNVSVADVLKVPRFANMSEPQAATLSVNPPTAYNLLSEFIDLQAGDWVVQNGANSSVGQLVIQLAAARGLKTINCVRHRDNIGELRAKLQRLGADHVMTYDELASKEAREQVKTWTSGKQIRLGLNCVGGKEATWMARLLGRDAHLVSYGAMSKQPLSLPTSLFIFKNLTCHGFWQSRWYMEKSAGARENLLRDLVSLIQEGKLQTPEYEIISIGTNDSDEAATDLIRVIMAKQTEGGFSKKVLLKLGP